MHFKVEATMAARTKSKPKKLARRVGNNMKRYNALVNSETGQEMERSHCPSGSLRSCLDSCGGTARVHSLCIWSCDQKCARA